MVNDEAQKYKESPFNKW